MKTIQIGARGPEVSLIGFGTGSLGGRYEVDKSSDQETEDLLREAIDLGVNFFDTAEVYADGHAETILGWAIADCREDIVIATKFSPANSTLTMVSLSQLRLALNAYARTILTSTKITGPALTFRLMKLCPLWSV